jgi:hypothetical protein
MLHQIMCSHSVYTYLITNYANPTALLSIPWSLVVSLSATWWLPSFTRSCLGRGGSYRTPFTPRAIILRIPGVPPLWPELHSYHHCRAPDRSCIWYVTRISSHPDYYTDRIILVLATYYTVVMAGYTSILQLSEIASLVKAINALNSVCDIAIAGAMVWLLHSSRTGLKSSDTIINRLVSLEHRT